MKIDAINLAIGAYFDGERREMLLILAACALAVAMAGALYGVAKGGFSAGFGATVLLAALLLGLTSVSLLRRDAAHRVDLASAVAGQSAKPALAAEAERIEGVIGKYRLYRYSAIALGALALLGVALSRNGVVNGIAAGLLLLAAAQMVVDHYSEQRALAYAAELPTPGS